MDSTATSFVLSMIEFSFKSCPYFDDPQKVAGIVLMEDGIGKAKIYPHHFEVPKGIRSAPVTPQTQNSPASQTRSPSSSSPVSKTKRRLSKATSMLNTFSLSGLPWCSTGKVELTAAEVESLRTEISNLEEREAHLKAQLEHLDELLRSARLAGYLHIRTRWTALPGEPPIEESEDVDDWLPRFLVLHGSCIFFFLHSADLSPQDSTLLSDIVDVGILPSFSQEDGQTRHSFFLLTKNGLRLECSTISEIQMKSWLTALEIDRNLESESTR